MIEHCIESWHRVLRGEPTDLDDLLADDVVFYSPVLFKPVHGKEMTRMYLTGAATVFGITKDGATFDVSGSTFRYVKEVIGGNHAVLEFEVEVEGKFVNGVDIITCNAQGRITEFKVMVRPMQALNALFGRMKALLEGMQGLR